MLKFRNILKTIREYFSPNPNQMLLSSKVETLRDELLKNCQYAIERLKTSKNLIEKGVQAVLSIAKETSSSSEDVVSYNNPEPDKISIKKTDDISKNALDIELRYKDKIINDIYSVIHGDLYQEWEHCLYGILGEGYIYYLSIGDPRLRLRLKGLRPTLEVSDIYTHIVEEVKDSVRGYEELFKKTRDLYKVEEPELSKEIQKQVQIRHIFQHNRGQIRKKDLNDIGISGPDACIYILNEEGESKPRKENDYIDLSLPEIQNFYDTIEKYSEAFLIQAQSVETGT